MATDKGGRLPLIVLPYQQRADRAQKSGGPENLHRPTFPRQRARLAPQYERLYDAFEKHRVEVRAEMAGVEPEMALVIEVAGTVGSFEGAVKKAGFDWLLESDLFEIPPDDDFYREDEEKKPISGSLYLVMSDHQARKELLSLWKRWEKTHEIPGAPKAWRTFFDNLKEIRVWGPEDRLRETGLLEDWRERLALGQEMLRTEIELWFLPNVIKRRRQRTRVRNIVEQAEGQILGEYENSSIEYHALLAQLPSPEAEVLVASQDVHLVQCDDVMFLRPVGQCLALPADGELGPELALEDSPPPSDRPPIAALLDGFPLEQHEALRNRLEIDDPDGWAADIPPQHRNHGTAMASLILHGDLSAGEDPLESPLHVRPVLKPAPAPRDPPPEGIPENVLMLDLIHRAVRRMFERTGSLPPAAPTVSIINFSIGDPCRPFDGFMSPLARLLDWLSWKYKVLFVVSAGNHGQPLSLSCRREDFSTLDPEAIEKEVVKSLVEGAHLRRILAPAEGVNVLTVGGEHADAIGDFLLGHRIDPFGASSGTVRVPSPVSAIGPGLRRAIKPEILVPGGRQLYGERLGNTHFRAELLQNMATAVGPGQRVAAPAVSSGSTGATRYVCGTSNAAALATRCAVKICEQFPTLFDDEGIESLPKREYLVPLLKALIVHGVRWGSSQGLMRDRLGLSGRSARAELGRYLGFGFLDETRILGCTEHRVTLVGWGHLGRGEGHVFQIPLPPSLAGQVVKKRLVVTLGYLTPINSSNRLYRKGQVWFAPESGGALDIESVLGVSRQEADAKAVGRGTVQHEVFEGDAAVVFVDGEVLKIKVNCREDAGKLVNQIPYGLVVSLEVAPGIGVQLPIYDEVSTRVAQIRTRLPQKIKT